MIPIKQILILETLFCLFARMTLADVQDSAFVSRTEIHAGAGGESVKWVKFSCGNDWRMAVKGFGVSGDREIFLNETESGKIKVYSPNGSYLRKFDDHGASGMFMSDSMLAGTRRADDGGTMEIIVMSPKSGQVAYRMPIGLSVIGWVPFETEGGYLYLRSIEEDRKILFFDMRVRVLRSNNNHRQYENESLNALCSTFVSKQYDKVGRIGDAFFFLDVDWQDSIRDSYPPCTYHLVAAIAKADSIVTWNVEFKESEIGYWIPGEHWPIVNNRYLYTIGYPRKGTKPGDKIWVTCIDLKKVFPQIFE